MVTVLKFLVHCPTPKVGAHPCRLSDCLFNIVISALHIWRLPSPFASLGGTMPWRLGPIYIRYYPHVWRPSPPFTTLGQQCHGDWDPLVVAATLHIWRPSPPFVTLGCIMLWWLGPTYQDLKLVVDLDFIWKVIVVLPEIHCIYFYICWHIHARTECLGSGSDKNLKSLLLR